MINQTCRILIVEDNLADFELAKHELICQDRFGIHIEIIEWSQSIKQAIERN